MEDFVFRVIFGDMIGGYDYDTSKLSVRIRTRSEHSNLESYMNKALVSGGIVHKDKGLTCILVGNSVDIICDSKIGKVDASSMFYDCTVDTIKIKGLRIERAVTQCAFDSCHVRRVEITDSNLKIDAATTFNGTRIEYACVNECDMTISAGAYGIFGTEAPSRISILDISNSKIRFLQPERVLKSFTPTPSVIEQLIAYDTDADEYEKLKSLFRHVKVKDVKTNIESIRKAWEGCMTGVANLKIPLNM